MRKFLARGATDAAYSTGMPLIRETKRSMAKIARPHCGRPAVPGSACSRDDALCASSVGEVPVSAPALELRCTAVLHIYQN